MAGPDAKITRLRIADTILSINGLDSVALPISDRLSQFQASGLTPGLDHIDISFIEDCPDRELYRQRVVDRKIIASVMPLADEVLFSCHTGQFVAFERFSKILLWAPFEAEIYEEYDGYPLLQLILWGRISQMGGGYLHGAVVVIGDRYVLLLGDSGVGKSTLSFLFVDKGHTCLTEENPFLTWTDRGPMVHASPWFGIFGPKRPVSGPLSAIFFLHHAEKNDLRRLNPQEAGRRLMGNARMFSWLPQTIPATIELLDDTIRRVPVFEFGFVPDVAAVDEIRTVLSLTLHKNDVKNFKNSCESGAQDR